MMRRKCLLFCLFCLTGFFVSCLYHPEAEDSSFFAPLQREVEFFSETDALDKNSFQTNSSLPLASPVLTSPVLTSPVLTSLVLTSALAEGEINSPSSSSKMPEALSIRSVHWPFKLPIPSSKHKILLAHDIFIAFFDLEKKFPSWLAYRLSPELVYGNLKLKRDYIPDPFLPKGSFLSYKDYKGASTCDKKATQGGYDKGHLAPLGSFKSSTKAWQANYLSNIVPQFRTLNQGPWRILEETVRSFVKKGAEVWILTGPLYGKEGVEKLAPCWKAAQGKIEEIPSHYWKIISRRIGSKIELCSFLMPQHIKNRKTSPERYIVPLSQIEEALDIHLKGTGKRAIKEACAFLFED